MSFSLEIVCSNRFIVMTAIFDLFDNTQSITVSYTFSFNALFTNDEGVITVIGNVKKSTIITDDIM